MTRADSSMIAAPIIGHRGAAGVAPENTLAAVRAAAELGVDWIEVDAQLSADGEAIIYHDARLERCTNGHGALADHDYAALRALDAGSHFDAVFAGEPMASLSELSALCRSLNIGINLELKLHAERDPAALAVVALDTLAQYGPDTNDILVSSVSHAALRACRRHDSQIQLGLICSSCPDELAAIRQELDLVSVHVDHNHVHRNDVVRARAEELEVYAWTVNKPQRARMLFDWGVSGIFTDFPHYFDRM